MPRKPRTLTVSTLLPGATVGGCPSLDHWQRNAIISPALGIETPVVGAHRRIENLDDGVPIGQFVELKPRQARRTPNAQL